MMALASEHLCRHYSLVDILLATKNFDNALVIGHGGFGKVYKGHINVQEGSSATVAIKRLDFMSDQGEPEFTAEIEMLSSLRHAHLVSLLGCCVDGKEMILVYEYMPHGTLHHHLHNSDTPLSWMERLRISIGAARGLDYLHTGAGTKHGVIHRDMKSSNILLDEDLAAKISDFGLAKTCPINQSSTYVYTGIKGTFGYLDPEIFMTGKFMRKTDVFAFGVVLFELLSGRHAVLPEGDEDLSLARWAQNCVKERNLDRLVAPEIRGRLSPKSLKEFAQIAYCCLHSDPRERPTMSEVVIALQLSLALQEKFENHTKPAGLFGFSWKMPTYVVLPRKENSGFGDKKSAKNRKINNASTSRLIEDSGEYNGVLLDNKQIHASDFKIFSYAELKSATRNFQDATISDRRGWIYKGWVNKKTYSPSEVDVGLAITVMSFHRRPEWDLQLLSEFRHPNLHTVLGYCLEGETLYLVHEFMEKRSLKDYLCFGAVIKELPFITRVKVVIGVARGLLFLQSKQLIIKDWILDTDEIWLDKDFNAKLFYFDVARLVFNGSTQLQLAGITSQRWLCDVHGFGQLLMEIITGEPIHGIRIRNYIERGYLYGEFLTTDTRIADLVDPRMKLKDTQMKRIHELLSLIPKCTRNHYTMEQALKELEEIYRRMTER